MFIKLMLGAHTQSLWMDSVPLMLNFCAIPYDVFPCGVTENTQYILLELFVTQFFGHIQYMIL